MSLRGGSISTTIDALLQLRCFLQLKCIILLGLSAVISEVYLLVCSHKRSNFTFRIPQLQADHYFGLYPLRTRHCVVGTSDVHYVDL